MQQIRKFIDGLKNPSATNRARINFLLQKFYLNSIPNETYDSWIITNGFMFGLAATSSIFFPVFEMLHMYSLIAAATAIKYFAHTYNRNNKQYTRFMDLFGYGFSMGFGLAVGFVAKIAYGVVAVSGFIAGRFAFQKFSTGMLAVCNKISQYVRFFNLQRTIRAETVTSELSLKDLTARQVASLMLDLDNNPKSAEKITSLDVNCHDNLSALKIPDNLINLSYLKVTSNIMLSNIFIPDHLLAKLNVKIYCPGKQDNPLKTAFNHLNLNGACNQILTKQDLQKHMDSHIQNIKQNYSSEFNAKIRLVDAVSKKFALPTELTNKILSFLPDSPANILYSKAFNIIGHVFSPQFSERIAYDQNPYHLHSYDPRFRLGYYLQFTHRKNTLVFSQFMDEKRKELKDEISKICDSRTSSILS